MKQNFKQNIKRGLSLFMTMLTALSVLLMIGSIYIGAMEKRTGELCFLFGKKPVYIESGSMEPVIPTGAIVILQQAGYGEVEEGDILTFETARGYVTHRLVGKDESAIRNQEEAFLITKGDANPVTDPELLSPDQILGKVTAVYALPFRLK